MDWGDRIAEKKLEIYNRGVAEIEDRQKSLDQILHGALCYYVFRQTPKEVFDEYREDGYTIHEAIREEISYL